MMGHTAEDELARIGSVMTEYVAVVDVEDMAGSLRTHLEQNRDLLAALDNLHGEFMSRMDLVRDEDWTPEEVAAEEAARAFIKKAKEGYPASDQHE